MKRLIIAFLVILLGVSLCEAQQVVVMKKKATGCSCTLYMNSLGGTYNNDFWIGNSTVTYYAGTNYQPSANIDVCKITFELSEVAGTLEGHTLTLNIWAGAETLGSIPVNPVTNGTTTLVCGSPNVNCNFVDGDPATGSNADFTFSTPVTLSNGSWYYITVDQGHTDASNYFGFYYKTTNTDYTGEAGKWKDDKTTTQGSASNARMRIYTCQ